MTHLSGFLSFSHHTRSSIFSERRVTSSHFIFVNNKWWEGSLPAVCRFPVTTFCQPPCDPSFFCDCLTSVFRGNLDYRSFQQPWGNIRMNSLVPQQGISILFSPMTYSASFITETKVFFFLWSIYSKYLVKIVAQQKYFINSTSTPALSPLRNLALSIHIWISKWLLTDRGKIFDVNRYSNLLHWVSRIQVLICLESAQIIAFSILARNNGLVFIIKNKKCMCCNTWKSWKLEIVYFLLLWGIILLPFSIFGKTTWGSHLIMRRIIAENCYFFMKSLSSHSHKEDHLTLLLWFPKHPRTTPLNACRASSLPLRWNRLCYTWYQQWSM